MSFFSDIFDELVKVVTGVDKKKEKRKAEEVKAAADAAARSQAASLAKIKKEQADQKRILDQREAETQRQELASRLVRSGKRKGLLTYFDENADLLGG